MDQLQLKPETPVDNISYTKPLTQTFAKKSPGGTRKWLAQGKKKQKNQKNKQQKTKHQKSNCWLCCLEQNDASMMLPGIRCRHQWSGKLMKSHCQVLLRTASLTCHGLKSSSDFSRKWDEYLKVHGPGKWFLFLFRGWDPHSQMEHEAGWRQRNHLYPGLASFQRCNGRRYHSYVKDRLGMCKQGWFLVHPSRYSCCHEIDRYWDNPEAYGKNYWLQECSR